MVSAGVRRTPTERIDIRSTVPVNGPMVTRSPVFIPFSNWIKNTGDNIFTSVWAPNEMASPSAPAPASAAQCSPHFGEQDHRRDGADNDRQRVTE